MHRRAAAGGGALARCAPPRARWRGCCSRSPRLTAALAQRSLRALLASSALPAAVVALVLALLFGEGGWEPFPIRSFIADGDRGARVPVGAPARASGCCGSAASVYLLACVLCLLVHSPMGSNVERYGVLLAGPLLLCALLRERSRAGAAAARRRLEHRSRLRWRSCAEHRVGRSGGPCARRARSRAARRRRLLLRAARALPAGAARRPGARRGAAHALALGGGAARTERLARARLGEAARDALRPRAAVAPA